MRNLEVLLNATAKLIDLDSDSNEQVDNFCIDEFANKLYVLTTKGNLYEFKYSALLPATTCKLQMCQGLGFESRAVSMDYIQELSALVVSFQDGTIITWKNNETEDQDEGDIQEVALASEGIIAASWSPNEEHFLVVKSDGVLVHYNTLFDIVSSVNLDDNDDTFEQNQEITPDNSTIKQAQITWKADSRIFAINYSINGGFKCLTRDTRMEIIKGPARADRGNVEINVRSVSEKPVEHMRLPVAMMPNGSLIAGFQVTIEENKEAKHEIIFWEKNGLRHGQMELPKFGGHLPYVKGMKFNADTTFLAVHIDFKGDRSSDNSIPPTQIIIMHRSNYHWFIKRAIPSISDIDIHDLHWSASKKNQLMIVDKDSNLSFYEFVFVYHTTSDVSTRDYKNLSYTANVDFNKVLLTPLAQCVIPPPMSEKVVELEGVAKALCFNRHHLFALLEHKIALIDCESGRVQYLDLNLDDTKVKVSDFQKLLFVESPDENKSNYGVLLALSSAYNSKTKCKLTEILLNFSSESVKIEATQTVACNRIYSWCAGPYQHFDSSLYPAQPKLSSLGKADEEMDADERMRMFLGHHSDEEESKAQNDNQVSQNVVYMQYLSKKIQTYTPQLLSKGEANFVDYEYQLSHLCYQLCAVFCQGQVSLFSLSNNNKLSINGDLFSKDITSLLVTRNFVYFVNSQLYILYVYNLNRDLPKPVVNPADPDPSNAMPILPTLDSDSFHVRNIERGARLVCCNKTKTVLQMPRGNLEGIRHRIPLLFHTQELIESCQYGLVFSMLRKHKIDTNLICDIDYAKFKDNIHRFVDEVTRVDHLNLFIMSLKEEESKELMYLKPKSGEEIIKRQFADLDKDTPQSKINEICDLIREVLNKKATEGSDLDLTLPILTTYAKKTPQELKEVLYLIKKLKEEESGDERQVIPPHLNPQTMKKQKKDKKVYSEDALEYICWLVDANKLYNVALQTYDFDLVTMVATQTQKDPREFLPYLNSLKQMDSQYMRFKIQFDLKQYDLALEEISKADDQYFEEALAMIKKQRLYRQALRFYADKPELHKQIKLNFASYLHDRKYYEEAGLIYKYAEEYEKALVSLKETPNYQMLFAVAQLLDYSEDKLHALAVEYAEKLAKDNKNMHEAGIVLTKYHSSGDKDARKRAVELLIQSKDYFYAIESINYWDKQGDTDAALLRDQVKQGVKLAYELKYNDIDKRIKDYREKLLRLKIVQHEKKSIGNLNALGIGEGAFDAETMSQSQLSDASLLSGTHSLSGLSETSKLSQARVRMGKSKKKSKQKKKKKVPKEGSPFEEEMLVEYLSQIEVTKEERDEVSILMKALVYFGYIDESVNLHERVEKLMNITNRSERTLEQQAILDESPILHDLYNIKNTKYDEDFEEDWKDIRFMKH